MNRFHTLLAFLLGADRLKMVTLSKALILDHKRKANQRNKGEGFTKSELKILAVLALAMTALAMAGVAFWLRDRPDVFTFAALAVLALAVGGLSLGYIFSMMLGDEGFRVIASWPVDSKTFLAARLCEPMGICVAASLIACSPAALVLMLFSGTPLLTGLVFLSVCLITSMALFMFITCMFCLFMEFMGPEECGLLGFLCFMATAILGSRYMERYFEDQDMFAVLAFHHFSDFHPVTWLASLVQITHSPVKLWVAALGLFCIVALPYLLYRATAVLYTGNLAKSRVHGVKGRGRFWLPLLKLHSKAPADHAMAALCLAHGRADWRFRAQLAMIPVLLLGLTGGALLGDLSSLFADPLNHDNFFHPAILFIVVIAFPPILALPLLATSKDSGAAWIMKTSPVTRQSFAAGQRHVMRVVFVYPLLLISAAGYLYYQAPPLSIAAHLFMMGLIAEVMVCGLQHIFHDYPFALPNDDEAFAMKMLPIVMIYEAVSVLIGILIFHVLYRWWWAGAGGALLLLVMRYSFIKASPFQESHEEPESVALEEPEPKTVVDPRVPPLIAAVRDQRLHTANALMKPDLLHATDENGKAVRTWLEESDHPEIQALANP